SWVRSDQLKENDTVLVEQNEWVPADGTLISPEAVVDLSVLNGESMPRRVHGGGPINAGAKLLSSSAAIKVRVAGNKSFFGQLLSSVRTPSIAETDSSKLSNKASQVLLMVVLTISLLTLI